MSMKTLAARLQYAGGNQLGRINKQKLNSLKLALKNDYNTRFISTPTRGVWPCLINTNNLKSDYDKEYVSVEFESGLEAGDVFETLDNGMHWMVYLPIITETAYLRSEIIRCRYTLEVNGEEYWIYFQGPTETDLRWFQKNQINANELNLSGTIYIKNDANTKKFFKRFTRVKLDGHVWEVQVTDPISVPGILELEMQEYYDNTIEELPEIKYNPLVSVDPSPEIWGETVVKPDTTVGYSIDNRFYDPSLSWTIEDNPRVKVEEVMMDGRMCKVHVNAGTVKPFTLKYGDHALKITVDWERNIINGPETVYPYEFHEYFIKCDDRTAEFSIDSKLAKIVEQDGKKCKVEILTGRSGQFTLHCDLSDGEASDLVVKIDSL